MWEIWEAVPQSRNWKKHSVTTGHCATFGLHETHRDLLLWNSRTLEMQRMLAVPLTAGHCVDDECEWRCQMAKQRDDFVVGDHQTGIVPPGPRNVAMIVGSGDILLEIVNAMDDAAPAEEAG